MKVAQLLYSGLGGHGSVAFSLLDSDDSKSWTPIMGFLGIEPLLHDYKLRCDEIQIPYEYFHAIQGKPWLTWLKTTSWLFKERPDVIILHSVKALAPCLIYAKRFSVPLIFVEHQANLLKTASDWAITRLGMLFADKIVYLTPEYKKQIQDKLGFLFHPNKVVVISNGINTEIFLPKKKTSLQSDHITIGMAARFTSLRCQYALVQAMVVLVEIMPSVKWHLTLAGNGETLGVVQDMILELGLSDRVTTTGYLDEKELVEWFHSLDIYAHASKGETLSTSMLQAMACGLPIVASDVSGISHLISEPKICGLLVKDQKPSSFADEIIKLVKTPEFASQLGMNGRQLVLNKYSHDVMFDCYRNLINAALSCRNL